MLVSPLPYTDKANLSFLPFPGQLQNPQVRTGTGWLLSNGQLSESTAHRTEVYPPRRHGEKQICMG